ncbi:MAG: FecR family protein, partial [Xanthobacteraceae bacterium]
MAYGSSTEGGYGIGASVFHLDASHPDRIDIPDPELLFRGHFGRSGPDLVLTGQDGHHHVVPDYFASEKHPSLYAPNGAHLSGDLVDLLAGSPTPGHYAQANGLTLPPDAIGKVQKVVGNVTVLRNGTAVTLHVGDAVHKSDVIETAANSSCGIAFPDGTALDVVAGTRMALNDYTYDVAGAPNNALFTLVEGTFAFVAGQVAHSGDGMKITTPVATMGIRGTVGLFKSEATVVNSRLGHVWSVVLHEDLDGSHHLGRIAIIDQDPTSATFGQVIYLLDSSEYIAYLEPQGSGLPPHVRVEPITSSRQFDDRHFYDDLNQIISAYNGANPRSGPNGGSGDNPNLLLPQQPNQENGGQPFPINFQPNSSGEGPNTTLESFSVPVQGGILPNSTPTTPAPLSTIFIWNSSGPSDWPTDPNWNTGSAPDSPIDQVIIQSGTVNYDLPGNTAVSALTVDPGAILDVTS